MVYLWVLSVWCGTVRLRWVLGERESEHSEQVAIGGLDISERLNHGLDKFRIFHFRCGDKQQLLLLFFVRLTCLFLIIERNLSVVKSMLWKFVRHTLPWVSSMIRLNFLNESSLSCKSPRDDSKTRPFRASVAISFHTQKQFIINSNTQQKTS